jgi:hypothetical protein
MLFCLFTKLSACACTVWRIDEAMCAGTSRDGDRCREESRHIPGVAMIRDTARQGRTPQGQYWYARVGAHRERFRDLRATSYETWSGAAAATTRRVRGNCSQPRIVVDRVSKRNGCWDEAPIARGQASRRVATEPGCRDDSRRGTPGAYAPGALVVRQVECTQGAFGGSAGYELRDVERRGGCYHARGARVVFTASLSRRSSVKAERVLG